MPEGIFGPVAEKHERIAAELEAASEYARVSATHYREREVPRGCTHAFAIQGHMRTAQNILDELSILHASKARSET